MNDYIQIRIERKVAEELRKKGNIGDTYNSVLKRMLGLPEIEPTKSPVEEVVKSTKPPVEEVAESPKNIETESRPAKARLDALMRGEDVLESPTNAESPDDQKKKPESLEERYPDLIGMFGRERNRYLYNLVLDGKISKEEMERNKG